MQCRSADELCRLPSRTDSDRVRVNALSKQQRRTTSILVAVVLFFFFAWLPHNVREMVRFLVEKYVLKFLKFPENLITHVNQPAKYL